MNKLLTAAAVGVTAAGAAGLYGAKTLFDRTIPRQDTLRVDLNEMADMATWEEYKKFITPTREWLTAQPLEDVFITSRDGLKLHGLYFAADKPSDTLVICNHGYTGQGIRDCSCISVFFHKLGFDCLIVDHRAHGQSEGDYVGFGILDRYDCRGWIDYVDARFEGKKDIVLYGVSMGATIALMVTGLSPLSRNVKAVIADCGFTSPYDVFAHVLKKDYHLPPFPVMQINDVMCRRKAGYGFKDYSTIDAVKVSSVPVLFIHGRNDNFVPVWMTEKNYEECRASKDILLVDNAGHAASYYQERDTYENKVKDFLSRYKIKVGG